MTPHATNGAAQALAGAAPPNADRPKEAAHPEELQALVETLRSRDLPRRLAAARCLQTVGAPAVPVLVAVLDRGSPEFREAVLTTLGLIGPAAKEAIPHLEALLEDETLAAAADRALTAIRRRHTLDGKRLVRVILPSLASLVLLAGVIGVAWMTLFAPAQGVARQVALAWALLGAVVGVLLGVRGGRGWGMAGKWAAVVLATAGGCAGAFLGHWAGVMAVALVRSLPAAG